MKIDPELLKMKTKNDEITDIKSKTIKNYHENMLKTLKKFYELKTIERSVKNK